MKGLSQLGMTCGNPCPVVDRATGVIWLPFCKNLADGDEDLITVDQALAQVKQLGGRPPPSGKQLAAKPYHSLDPNDRQPLPGRLSKLAQSINAW